MGYPVNNSDTYKQQIAEIGAIRNASHYSSIQAAIDVGVGLVRVTEDTTITSAITVNAGVHLVLNPDVTILNTADTDVVILAENGQISGGALRNTNASFSKAILKVEADNNSFTAKLQRTFAQDILLHGSDTGDSGYGIHLYATGDNGSSNVQWCQFRNINIHNVSECIRLECQEDSGDLAYVNGNIFDGITMDWCHYGVRTVTSGTGTPAVNGNQFTGLQLQARSTGEMTLGTQRAIEQADRSAHNFYQMEIWDWGNAPQTTGIVNNHTLGTGSQFHVNGDVPVNLNDYDIHVDGSSPDVPRFFADSGLPGNMQGRVVYINTSYLNCLAVNTGGLWKGVGGLITQNTSVSKTLNINEIGAGVYWRSSGASGTVDFDLSNIDCVPGEECIFRNLTNGQDISLTAEASNSFRMIGNGTWNGTTDQTANGATITTAGATNADYIHIRCYVNNIWDCIAWNGTWDD